ncbi:CSN5 [Scenedesmus sp. PABB004]|nr:CSN5 [Scenedesmus sp. PABB004]
MYAVLRRARSGCARGALHGGGRRGGGCGGVSGAGVVLPRLAGARAASPLLANREFAAGQIVDIAEKLEQADGQLAQGARLGRFGAVDEQIKHLSNQVTKALLFNCSPRAWPPAPARAAAAAAEARPSSSAAAAAAGGSQAEPTASGVPPSGGGEAPMPVDADAAPAATAPAGATVAGEGGGGGDAAAAMEL